MLKKTLSLILTALMLLCALTGCMDGVGGGDNNNGSAGGGNGNTENNNGNNENGGSSGANNEPTKNLVYAEIVVKEYGSIIVELYPDIAPITVENFVTLANQGFYDGLTFHRVVEDFMIQGGDPNANGTGNSGTFIKGEFKENGVANTISHKRGTVSMARGNNYNSASCQFFICTAKSTYLDGVYAGFGVVISGMDVVDAIVTGTLPYTPYYEYYGTDEYDRLGVYGYLTGIIKDKSKQAVIETVRVLSEKPE